MPRRVQKPSGRFAAVETNTLSLPEPIFRPYSPRFGRAGGRSELERECLVPGTAVKAAWFVDADVADRQLLSADRRGERRKWRIIVRHPVNEDTLQVLYALLAIGGQRRKDFHAEECGGGAYELRITTTPAEVMNLTGLKAGESWHNRVEFLQDQLSRLAEISYEDHGPAQANAPLRRVTVSSEFRMIRSYTRQHLDKKVDETGRVPEEAERYDPHAPMTVILNRRMTAALINNGSFVKVDLEEVHALKGNAVLLHARLAAYMSGNEGATGMTIRLDTLVNWIYGLPPVVFLDGAAVVERDPDGGQRFKRVKVGKTTLRERRITALAALDKIGRLPRWNVEVISGVRLGDTTVRVWLMEAERKAAA